MIPSDKEETLAAVHTRACACVCVEEEGGKRRDLGLIHRHYGEQDVICKPRLTHTQAGIKNRVLNKCASVLRCQNRAHAERNSMTSQRRRGKYDLIQKKS